MDIILTVIGIMLATIGTVCLLRQIRADSLIVWGGVIDIGLMLCALGTESIAGSMSAWLILLFTFPARVLAWVALGALCGKDRIPSMDSLAGIGTHIPTVSAIFCFALAASMDISPFLNPEGKHFALYALGSSHILFGALMAIPYAVMLWRTVQTILSVFFAEGQHQVRSIPNTHRWIINALTILIVAEGFFRNSIVGAVLDYTGISVSDIPNLAFHSIEGPLLVIYLGVMLLIAVAFFRMRISSAVCGYASAIICGVAFCWIWSAQIEPLCRLFALISTGIGALVSLYSVGYIHDDGRRISYFALLLMTFASVTGVVLSTNAGTFVVFWELMSWASFFLIAWDKTTKARSAAILYLVICGAGAYLFTPLLFALSGQSLNLLSSLSVLHGYTSGALAFGFFAVAIGFAAKIGLVPLHIWLPAAHPEAPSSVSAPLSGVLTKTGIFGIIVLFWYLIGNDALHSLGNGPSGLSIPEAFLVCIGLVTMFLGEIRALRQTDVKKMFAYSTIGQVGEIIAVLGVGTWLAMTGALTHVLNHAIMKDLLFLSVGALIMRAGSRNLSDMAGIARFMPWTSTCLVIGLIAIMGLPPFNGFIGKYVMIAACMEAGHVGLAVALLIGSLIGAAYYMRVARVVVLESPSEELKQSMKVCPHAEAPWSIRLPLLVLSGLCVILGVMPQIGLDFISSITNAMADSGRIAPGHLPHMTVEWKCYVALPVLGAVVPVILRKKDAVCAYVSALILAVTAVLVAVYGRELDMLSYGMALVVPFMGAVNMLYARGYMEHSHTRWRFYTVFLIMTGGLIGVASSHELFSFFTFWEIMSSWTLYFVIAHEGTHEALRDAGQYFLFNVAGAGFLFVGVGIFAGIGGASDFDTARIALNSMPVAWGIIALAVFAIGFTMKAAQVALRIDWQMHPDFAPTPVSGYISSVLLKIAVFGLVKLFFNLFGVGIADGDIFHREFVMNCVAWAGGFTLLFAAFRAMVQERVKMVFIWSTVSQIGYMVLGVAVGTSLGVAGGLLQAANHMLFKDLLFFVAGSVMFATHKEFLRDLGGIGRSMPVTMGCFALGALAAAGVPPTNGFTSKWIIYQALMQEGHIALAFIALLGSAVTLAYLVRFLLVVFLGQPAQNLEHIHEVGWTMRAPMYLLSVLTIITGIFPGLFLYPVNIMLSEFGLESLAISLFGIDSGSGAWNAGIISLFMILLFVLIGWSLYAVARKVPKRVLPPHACGLDSQSAFTKIQPEGVYQAMVRTLHIDGQNLKTVAQA